MIVVRMSHQDRGRGTHFREPAINGLGVRSYRPEASSPQQVNVREKRRQKHNIRAINEAVTSTPQILNRQPRWIRAGGWLAPRAGPAVAYMQAPSRTATD